MKKGYDGNIIGSNINNNKTIFVGTCHTIIESEDKPQDQAEEASDNEKKMTEEYLDSQVAGVSDNNDSTTNVSNNHRVRFSEE